jgi:hypothetical protein
VRSSESPRWPESFSQSQGAERKGVTRPKGPDQ